LHTKLIALLAAYHVAREDLWHRLVKDEHGEGVISAAIAVLIMAFLGAGMWVAFNAVFKDASGKIETQVGSIGG
jgi:hypothetical protein